MSAGARDSQALVHLENLDQGNWTWACRGQVLLVMGSGGSSSSEGYKQNSVSVLWLHWWVAVESVSGEDISHVQLCYPYKQLLVQLM